jgi:hypothetical protein
MGANVYHRARVVGYLVNHGQQRVKPAFTSFEPCPAYRVGMDIGFDPKHWQPDSMRTVRDSAPDWLVLRAQMSASWSARRALQSCLTPKVIRSGSFDRGSAAAVAWLEARQAHVNPTALGNGKPDHAIDDDTAAAIPNGSRGIQ